MRTIRASWLILIVAIVIITGLKPLRDQARRQGSMLVDSLRAHPAVPGETYEMQSAQTALASCWQRCVEFVELRHPDDAEMLMAAGALVRAHDREAALSLLKRAAEAGGGPPAWAAYAETLVAVVPSYVRLGTWGIDPGEPEAVAAAQRDTAAAGAPAELSPEEAAPILDALQGWQAADPDNALPVALATYYLYGLHRDDEALARWEAAGALPTVVNHGEQRMRAIARLLVRTGMPEAEAILAASYAIVFPTFARLRECARIASYEGRLAQIEGRPEDAIRWWNATIQLARHMQESTDTVIGLLVGAAMQSIGASPSWCWYHDGMTGIPGGPLLGGRVWYGPQHDFYLSQVGEAADLEVRDAFVASRVRMKLTRQYTSNLGAYADYERADRLLLLGLLAALLLILLLIVFLIEGTWARRSADDATSLRNAWQIIIAALVVLPAGVASFLAIRMPLDTFSYSLSDLLPIFVGALAVAAFAALLLPLLAAAFSRSPSARLRTAWRGNLRRVLPVAIALSALLYLGLGLAATRHRARWVRRMTDPGTTEMTRLADHFGPAWTDPTIPPDAWRAEYPPERTRG
jgi:hypothetical protein